MRISGLIVNREFYCCVNPESGIINDEKSSKSVDTLTISPAGRKMLTDRTGDETGEVAELRAPESRKINGEQLSEAEKSKVEELAKRDSEVRAHEQAHLSAAGGLAAGGARFKFQNGPDGKQYAVGGEVSLQIKEGNNPQENLRYAQQLERAALAPAEPSAQDRAIANKARQQASDARREIAEGNINLVKGGNPALENEQTSNTEEKGKITESRPDVSANILSNYGILAHNKAKDRENITDIEGSNVVFDRGESGGFSVYV